MNLGTSKSFFISLGIVLTILIIAVLYKIYTPSGTPIQLNPADNAVMQPDNGEQDRLGIHKGEGINILGYVQKSEELNSWIDVSEYL